MSVVFFRYWVLISAPDGRSKNECVYGSCEVVNVMSRSLNKRFEGYLISQISVFSQN